MKKLYLFSLIAFSLVSINAFAQDEDLHDAAVLSEHFKSPQQFTTWYKELPTKDKNLVLAGTVHACRSELTQIALNNGGDVNTKLLVLTVTSGHDEDGTDYLYTYNRSDGDQNLVSVRAIQDGVKRSQNATKKEDCGHDFSTMGATTQGFITLNNVATQFCKQQTDAAKMNEVLKH